MNASMAAYFYHRRELEVQRRAEQIAEAAARMMHEQGVLSGPTRALIDADLSKGWPRFVDIHNKPHSFSFYCQHERPSTHAIDLIMRGIVLTKPPRPKRRKYILGGDFSEPRRFGTIMPT